MLLQINPVSEAELSPKKFCFRRCFSMNSIHTRYVVFKTTLSELKEADKTFDLLPEGKK